MVHDLGASHCHLCMEKIQAGHLLDFLHFRYFPPHYWLGQSQTALLLVYPDIRSVWDHSATLRPDCFLGERENSWKMDSDRGGGVYCCSFVSPTSRFNTV